MPIFKCLISLSAASRRFKVPDPQGLEFSCRVPDKEYFEAVEEEKIKIEIRNETGKSVEGQTGSHNFR